MPRKFLFFFFILTASTLSAQPPQVLKYIDEKARSIALSANIPIGDFSKTHFGGIGAEYAPGRHWYSKTSPKKFRFTYNTGLAYYFGKKENLIDYSYDYPGYLFLHAFAGLLYIPVRKMDVKLTAGPGLGIYDGTTRFNIGSKLEGTYFISRNIAIGPGIILMKENGADAIWSAALKAVYIF